MNTQNETNLTADQSRSGNALNPISVASSADSADSASSALNQSTRPSTGRPLSRLLDLSEHQLQVVDAKLKDGVAPRKIVEYCRTEFGKEIPYMTFVRYRNRCDSTRQIEELAASHKVAAELSRFAATGDPSFSANTLATFEQMAFDLAVAFSRDHDADDLTTIQQLWPLIHRAKSTAIRERHAAVQEKKCALRAEELAFKRESRHTPTRNLNLFEDASTVEHIKNGATSRARSASHLPVLESASPTSTSRVDINSNDEAPADLYPPDDKESENDQNPSETPVSETQNSKFITQNSASAPAPLTDAEIEALIPHVISPRPLPPEVIRANIIYAEKVRTGKIIIDRSGPWIRAIELPDANARTASGKTEPADASIQPHQQTLETETFTKSQSHKATPL